MNKNEIRESGELELGIEVKGVIHRAFTLRPVTLADTYRAAASIAIPDDLDSNSPSLVSYQMALDDAVVLCQIESLGEDVPYEPMALSTLAESIDPDDMAILRQAATNLKKKWRQSRSALSSIAVPNTSSSAPDSA